MDSAREQFVTDAQEIVDRLYADLQQLRARRARGRDRRELAARIFRHVHTLKGSAGAFGFQSVGEVAHEFEGVLDGVRLGRVTIDDSLLNLFDATTDAIAGALAETGGANPQTQSLLPRLHAIAQGAAEKGAISSNLRSALPEEIARSLSEYDLQHAREAVREGAKLFIVDASFGIETFDRDFRELTAMLGQGGEVIATVPGAPSTADEINLRLLYATEMISPNVRRRAEDIAGFECAPVELDYAALSVGATPTILSVVPETGISATSVRVGLKDLDDLTAAVTDLLRDTNNAVVAPRAPVESEAGQNATTNLRRRFVQLEERLIKLRLVPLSDLLNGAAARAGQSAARQLKKEVTFEVIGGEVEIDKSLADLIAEPLMHLVRNAVSHGIETAEERVAAGKSAAGLVTLHGLSEGSRVYIVVQDDGRGIDFERVGQSAAENGIVTRPEDLTTEQALRLIFRPGFSTAAQASELSGRGVGLEIVDHAMTQAGGEVRLTSEPGCGARFVMIVPATLALTPCVIVKSGGQFYCFDESVVAEQLMLSQPLMPAHDFEWQGQRLSLLPLRELLGQDGAAADHSQALLVCKPNEHRQTLAAHHKPVAVLVDAIAGQQEILVRSLGPHSSLWHGISGAAEMVDGNIALMLDLARLIEANES